MDTPKRPPIADKHYPTTARGEDDIHHRSARIADELWWRSRPVWEIEAEQQRRFELYFTAKRGYPVKWCALCESFDVEHTHQA